MRVLVTGGAGFIGSNLCRRLLEEDSIEEVRVLDDLSTGSRSNLNGMGVSFVEGSILDVPLLRQVAEGCTAVVHLAALGSVPRSVADPIATHSANATGTLNVLETARVSGGMHVVLASSSSVYGSNPKLPKTEDLMCMPLSPYAVSKLAAEQYAMAFAQCYSLPVLPFRFFNVYGPGQPAGHQYAAVIPVFLDAVLKGEPVPLHGDGTQSRDFTFVGTVVEILTRAVLDSIVSSPTNLAFGTRTSLNELVDVIESQLGRRVTVNRGPARLGDVKASQADNSRLRELFDVSPVSLENGVAQTIAWMINEIRVRSDGRG